MSGTFQIQVRDNAAILKGGFDSATTDYVNGSPATNGPVYTPTQILGVGYTAAQVRYDLFMPGFVDIVTTGDGTFDVGSVIPGFNPTTSISAYLLEKHGTMVAGEFIRFQNRGMMRTFNLPVPNGGSTEFNARLLSLGDYRSFFLLFTDLYQIDLFCLNASIFLPRPPYPTGFETFSEWGIGLFGQYDIIVGASTWRLRNLTHPSMVNEGVQGDRMELYSDPEGSYDFSTVETINLGPTTITVFEEKTPIHIIFEIPGEEPPGEDKPVEITNPTQFTGTAFVGYLTVLQADASGIYTITSGKANDTLYLSNENDLTEDVAIPDPTIKTGFIGG